MTVISHVRQNLDGDLSLNTLSRVGCFSKFHFHRVFKSITEETVNDMVVRMRLDASSTSITEMRAGEAKLDGVEVKTFQRNK
jgi:hypothetical protein